MLFNSFPYIFCFLPIVIALTLLARKVGGPRAAQAFVLLASLFFYTWWRPVHLLYLLGSIVANWQIARWIAAAEQPRRKRFLQFGLFLNIAFLCIFKYVNFFLKSFPHLIPPGFLLPDLEFPLGISFFTITQIMYLVDCYESLLPASSLFDHATFVSFFPYVISGPIARAKRILHQVSDFGGKDGERSDLIARGVYLFSFGLFKKVVFADAFARVAAYGISSTRNMSTLEAWVFSIAYTMQIYFDFSGYSDMAIASALMLGIEIPRNFDAPYRAQSIIKFWQRWHISLTNFITTYLYTPILKKFERASLTTASIATVLAMAIAGLWHGPAWTFVCWGILHGIALAINQFWNKKKIFKLPGAVSWLLTFSFVNTSFIIFHSRTLSDAGRRIAELLPQDNLFGILNLLMMRDQGIILHILGPPLIIGLFVAFLGKSSEELAREFRPSFANSAAVVTLTLIAWIFMNSTIVTPFVYFAF
jgi:D-alanyl-lipoteichoic acid acyltransferase DltB (MBOAT superfamily)